MKKLFVFVMLLMTASSAMAQFGKLEDIGKSQNNGNNQENSIDSPAGTNIPGIGRGRTRAEVQIVEEAVKDGLFLICQEYQLVEKSNPGGIRYRWGEESYFGYGVSFIVRLNDGFITTSKIVYPWADDDNFTAYERDFTPVISTTKTIEVGQNKWKNEALFQPEEIDDLNNGLLYVRDSLWQGEGFVRAAGYGKKDVFLIWLVKNSSDVSVSFQTDQMTIEVGKGQSSSELKTSQNPIPENAVGGIVVEPIYKGIGRIDLSLLGVVNMSEEMEVSGNNEDSSGLGCYSISLLPSGMGEGVKVKEVKTLNPDK